MDGKMQAQKGNVIAVRSKKSIAWDFRKHWQLYLLLLLPVAYIVIFCYIPMGGILIAFEDFSARRGIFGSRLVGFKYLQQFLSTPLFWDLIKNTLYLSLYSLIAGFPIPIILALALNEVRSQFFKKTVQMVTYAPYFISTVVMVGIIMQFLHLRTGFVNNVTVLLGGQPINYMGEPNMFRSIYVWSGIWQTAGYSAVIYIAALVGVDVSIVEASIIDGANRIQKIIHIDLPSISPTIIILLLLAVGNIMGIGFEKVFLMQNSANLPVSEIISTYVYKKGLINYQYSFATAVGLFNSVVNTILLLLANAVARRVGETSLW